MLIRTRVGVGQVKKKGLPNCNSTFFNPISYLYCPSASANCQLCERTDFPARFGVRKRNMDNPGNGGNPGLQNQNALLKSKTSRKHAYIRFINMTKRRVDVIWINYEGVRVKYKTLEPTEYFDVTSFVNHPWIFRDAETHTKLVVSSQEVFDVPEPVYLRLQNGRVQATRAIVGITLPLYSLYECALQAVHKLIREPADVESLEIPFTLKKELLERCNFNYKLSMMQCTRMSQNAD